MVNYLTRYWSVSSAGISDFLCDVSGNYVPADIVGEESAQVAGKYSGSLPWTKYSPLAGNTLTANGIDSFSDFTGITLAPPTVSISADPGFLVCKDDELNLTAVPIGDLSFTYLWSPGGAMTQTISPSTASPGTSLFMVEVTDGNGFTSTSSVSIGVNSINLTGTLKYNNADQTVLSGVELTILPSGVNISSTTDADGIYTFTGLCPGNYTIEVTGIDKEVGYINSTDAAQINAWAVSGLPIERVKWMSGDVTYSGAVNSTDAKAVQNFFVYFWPFTRGEWTFWKAGQMVNSGDMNVEIPVNLSGNLELNLYGQAVGDFNGSFTPGGLKAASSTLDLAYGETRLAGAAVEVELPVRMVNAGEIGAASLILNYPAELFEVTGVSMKLEIGNLDWNAKGGELRIGWNSLIPLQLEANSLWLTITGRTTESFGEGDEIRLALAPDPLNELADGSFNVIPDAKLQIDVLAFSTTGTSDNGQWTMDNGQLKFSSQPNPFANFTTLVYTLPAQGHVTLEITDMLGRRVALPVDEHQQAGEYSLKLDATPLQPGVYMATLRLITGDSDFATSIKLIRNR
jgi:hypothetical protein